jgi:hypothetical protein
MKVSALGGVGDKVWSRVKVCRVCGAKGVNYAEAALTLRALSHSSEEDRL